MNSYSGSGMGTISLFPPLSCAHPTGNAHNFRITISENIAFRCCETCGLTHRLRGIYQEANDAWQEINEPDEEREQA